MSAPATNALSPAPVMTTTRTSSSRAAASSAPSSAHRTAPLSALRLSGRLIVSSATAPRRSSSTSFWSVIDRSSVGQRHPVISVHRASRYFKEQQRQSNGRKGEKVRRARSTAPHQHVYEVLIAQQQSSHRCWIRIDLLLSRTAAPCIG